MPLAAGVDVVAGAARVEICCSESPLRLTIHGTCTDLLKSSGRLTLEYPVVGRIECEIATIATPQPWLDDLLEAEGKPPGRTAYIVANDETYHIEILLIERGSSGDEIWGLWVSSRIPHDPYVAGEPIDFKAGPVVQGNLTVRISE